MNRPLLTALLYAALALTANPAVAGGPSPALNAEIEALRSGPMRKLILQEGPRSYADVAFFAADGAPLTFGDSNGKIRVVNFWATWCAPCRQEKPTLDRLNAELGGADFEVISIATGRNTKPAIKRFNREVGVKTLTTFLDPKSGAAQAMGVLGLPVTVILDREGHEIGRVQGATDWGAKSTRAIIKWLIARGS